MTYPLHPYRRIAGMLLLALLLALTFTAGVFIGVTFASGPSDSSLSIPAGLFSPLTGVTSGSGVLNEAPTVPPPSPTAVAESSPPESVSGTLTGIASWFATGRDGMYAAAGSALRVGDWRGSRVQVCAETCVVVVLNDWCACRVAGQERLVDLSDEAFAALAPLSRGLVAVEVLP